MKKTVLLIALGLFVVSCTPPVRDYLEEQEKNNPPADSAVVDTSGAQSVSLKKGDSVPVLPPPKVIELESWPGERFVLLEKPALYCKYGYELYTCPKLDSCRGPIDTAVETKYHRVKCGKFANAMLSVVTVEPVRSEWLVTFKEDTTGRMFYAKTSAGELHEFAYANDCDGAKKRWLGKTIYSARGFISVIDSGTITTAKVKVQEPLKVLGVRYGITPLPAKPLWLMVETRDNRKGAIPMHYTWTNVKKELRHGGNAWDDDVFETDPARDCKADSATWETINMHHVRQGMTRDQVRLSWGRPIEQKSGEYNGKERECWAYENQRLWFDKTDLVGIDEVGGKGK